MPNKRKDCYCTLEIDFNDKTLNVNLESVADYENEGIGPYEFWGFKGNDSRWYWVINEEIKWNKNNFNDEENKYIESYVEKEFEYVERKLIESIIE